MFLFGSLAATLVVTLPFLGMWCLFYGIPPPPPSWITLRTVQLLQEVVVSGMGGYLALRYFRARFEITYAEMRCPLTILV